MADLEPLYTAYRAVKRSRDARAPLDLDLPERKIVLTAMLLMGAVALGGPSSSFAAVNVDIRIASKV